MLATLALAATSMGHDWRVAVGLTVGTPSLLLLLLSRRQLGTSFSATPQARRLVTTGIYSKIQHPMYFFLDLVFIAVIVAVSLPVLLAVWVLLVMAQTLQSRREERSLANAFGAEYEAYRCRTWL